MTHNEHTQIINLTPHDVTVCDERGTPLRTIAPSASGTVARVSTRQTPSGEIDGLPVHTVEFGSVDGLPPETAGVVYLVSGLVRSACPDRKDLVSPGPLVRDEHGRPVGCHGLAVSS